MTDKLDVNLSHLNRILDTVTESLVDITKIRDEQNKSISEISRTVDLKTNTLTEKCNKIENKLRRTENDMIEDINKVRSQNKTVTVGLDKRIVSLEIQIKLMDEAIQNLKLQHEENTNILNELKPKVGKKRKWWQVI
jgi:hypothetical protein